PSNRTSRRRAAPGAASSALSSSRTDAPRGEGTVRSGMATRATMWQPLLPAAEGVHVHGELLERRLVETSRPGRHDAEAGVVDRLGQRRAVAPVQPDRVGEARGTELDVAAAVLAVAGGAL